MPHTYIYSMLHVGNVSYMTANVQRDTVQTRKGSALSVRARTAAERTFNTMSLPSASLACLLSSSCSADCDAVHHKEGTGWFLYQRGIGRYRG